MLESLGSPLGQRFTWVLVHFLWQGCAIAAAVGFILAWPRMRTQARYAVALVGLLLMAMCPVATFVALGQERPPLEQVAIGSSGIRNNSPALADHLASSAVQFAGSGIRKNSDVSSYASEFLRIPLPDTLSSSLRRLQPGVLLAWQAGVLFFALRLLGGYWGTLRMQQGRFPISAELLGKAERIGRRLGVAVRGRVFGSRRVCEAVAVGFWRPVVLLPASWLLELPPSVLEAVVAHELAHIRRHDAWANLFQRLLETLLFYHPAVWWLSNRVRLEREMCCDELAVAVTGGRLSYASALEQVGRHFVARRFSLAASITGEGKMNLLRRIHNVLGARRRENTRSRLVGLVAVAIPLLVVAVLGVLAKPQAVADGPRDADQKAATVGRAQRDGDGSPKPGPRNGEGAKQGPRDGEGAKPSPRDGEGAKPGPRDGEGAKPGPREGDAGPLGGFRPQTQREAALYQMILALQNEVAQLRREMQGRGQLEGEGESQTLPPNWRNTQNGRVFKAYDKNGDEAVTVDEWLVMRQVRDTDTTRRELETGRFNEADPNHDGQMTPAEFIFWYSKGRFQQTEAGQRPLRDGEGVKPGPRDGEGPAKAGPRDEGAKPALRDGEGPAKAGPRDGEGVKPGPRDGEGVKPGPRDGEGPAKPGPRDGEGPAKPGRRDGEAPAKSAARDQ